MKTEIGGEGFFSHAISVGTVRGRSRRRRHSTTGCGVLLEGGFVCGRGRWFKGRRRRRPFTDWSARAWKRRMRVQSAGSGDHGAAKLVKRRCRERRSLLLMLLLLHSDVITMLLQDASNLPSALIRIVSAVSHTTMRHGGRFGMRLLLLLLLLLQRRASRLSRRRRMIGSGGDEGAMRRVWARRRRRRRA